MRLEFVFKFECLWPYCCVHFSAGEWRGFLWAPRLTLFFLITWKCSPAGPLMNNFWAASCSDSLLDGWSCQAYPQSRDGKDIASPINSINQQIKISNKLGPGILSQYSILIDHNLWNVFKGKKETLPFLCFKELALIYSMKGFMRKTSGKICTVGRNLFLVAWNILQGCWRSEAQ